MSSAEALINDLLPAHVAAAMLSCPRGAAATAGVQEGALFRYSRGSWQPTPRQSLLGIPASSGGKGSCSALESYIDDAEITSWLEHCDDDSGSGGTPLSAPCVPLQNQQQHLDPHQAQQQIHEHEPSGGATPDCPSPEHHSSCSLSPLLTPKRQSFDFTAGLSLSPLPSRDEVLPPDPPRNASPCKGSRFSRALRSAWKRSLSLTGSRMENRDPPAPNSSNAAARTRIPSAGGFNAPQTAAACYADWHPEV